MHLCILLCCDMWGLYVPVKPNTSLCTCLSYTSRVYFYIVPCFIVRIKILYIYKVLCCFDREAGTRFPRPTSI